MEYRGVLDGLSVHSLATHCFTHYVGYSGVIDGSSVHSHVGVVGVMVSTDGLQPCVMVT